MSEYDDLLYDNATQETAFEKPTELYGKEIKPVPKPKLEIGIDRNNEFLSNILDEGTNSASDISKINSFTQVSQRRDQIYKLLDTMSEDPLIASALEIYAEDVTETNDKGAIMWCESDDPEIAKYVTFLLDTMNVDKNLYKWAYSLIKYGDLYLRLYRQSELEPDNPNVINVDKNERQNLNEDVVLNVFSTNDNYAHYVEMVPNPAEMFELTKFGKTYVYIEADLSIQSTKESGYMNSYYRYSFKRDDVHIYQPTEFVHASLDDNSSRVPEEVELFVSDEEALKQKKPYYTFQVKRGQSLLYNTFKVWREMTLLENSMLLNRLTKSSIVRIVNVEVGDMPKENVGPHLVGIKSLMEQKTAIDSGNSLNEYTNPGPVENNVYVPTHQGIGTLSVNELGGDTSVKGLEDVDYFRNKLSGSLKIPSQYLGFTDDATGFNGGTALSLVSSRYAKTIKRIQNQLIQAITDIVNLMLIDSQMDSYINKFTLRMQEPTTQEEIDRRDSKSTSVGIAQDVLGLVDGLQKESSKLKILKTLISPIVADSEITDIIQSEIELAEEQERGELDGAGSDMDFDDEDMDLNFGGGGHSGMHTGGGNDLNDIIDLDDEGGGEDLGSESELGGEDTGNSLPTPGDLGDMDFTDNNMEI